MSIDAVSDHSRRLEKFGWLTRPFDWAMYVCIQTLGMLLLMLWNGNVSTETMLGVALVSLSAVAGLLIWAGFRMGRAFNGQR